MYDVYVYISVVEKCKVSIIKWNYTDKKKVKILAFICFLFCNIYLKTLNFQFIESPQKYKHLNSFQVSVENLNQTKYFVINTKALNLSWNVCIMFSFQ